MICPKNKNVWLMYHNQYLVKCINIRISKRSLFPVIYCFVLLKQLETACTFKIQISYIKFNQPILKSFYGNTFVPFIHMFMSYFFLGNEQFLRQSSRMLKFLSNKFQTQIASKPMFTSYIYTKRSDRTSEEYKIQIMRELNFSYFTYYRLDNMFTI